MVPSSLRKAGTGTGTLFILFAFAACDAVGGPSRIGGGAPAGDEGAGAFVFSTEGADRFDLAFLPPELMPGQPLTAEVVGGGTEPLATLVSRPVGDGRHEVALALGTLNPRSVIVEGRYEGHVVATGVPVRGRDGLGAGTSFQEPTSVHYFYYQGPNGQWIIGVEYDYDMHEGGVTYEPSRGLPVRVDRIRFVLRGTGQPAPPEFVRIGGAERLVMADATHESGTR